MRDLTQESGGGETGMNVMRHLTRESGGEYLKQERYWKPEAGIREEGGWNRNVARNLRQEWSQMFETGY